MFSIIYILKFPTFYKNLCNYYCSQLRRHKFLWKIYFKMLSWYELAIPISYATSSTFSFLQNIVRSLKRNLDDFEVHLLDELQYRFNVIRVTETKTTEDNPKIPCFLFEYVLSPLTSFRRCFTLSAASFFLLLDFGVLEKDSARIEWDLCWTYAAGC